MKTRHHQVESLEFILLNLATVTSSPSSMQQFRQSLIRLAISGQLFTEDNSSNTEQRIWTTSPLEETVEILDFLRVPVSQTERDQRISGKTESELVPYYGATQQVGWIDNYIFDEELVLLGEDGVPFLDPLRPKAYVIRGKTWVNNHAHALRPKLVAASFLCYFLNSVDYSGLVSGTTRLKLTQSQMKKIHISFPPLSVQHRIVEEIDRLMALCDDLENRLQVEREERCRLRTASLAALEEAATAEEAGQTWAHVAGEFGRLVDTLEDVDELRNVILQFAAIGKLSGDGDTANQQCKSTSWKEVRVDEILSEPMMNGHSVPSAEKGFPVLRLSAVRNGWINLRERKIGKWTEKEAEPYLVREGDFLVVRGNGSRQLVGRGGLVAEAPDRIAFPDTLIRLRFDKTRVFPEWISLIWRSAVIRSQTEEKAHTTSGIYKVSQKDIAEIRFSLPLLAEQHRVVERVNRMMTFCDTLEAVIRARDAALEAFAAAACRAVLDGAAPDSAAVGAVTQTGQQRLPV